MNTRREQIQSRRRAAENAGRRAEVFAGLFLRLKGFSILAQRYRAPSGEIDLIARRGNLVAFIEVKHRAQLEDAIGAVSHKARRRIERAADMFIAQNKALAACDMRYDIIAIAGWRLRHLSDAWRYGE